MNTDGSITIGTELDTKEFDAQILQLERKINDMEKDLEISISTGEFKEDSEQADELRAKIEKAKNQLVALNKQKEKYNRTNYSTKDIESLDFSLGNALKKVGRIVLSVFSIRSALGAVSRASSTLAQYNEQYATNLEFIRYALAQSIAPLLQHIVKLAYTLMGYVNYLAKVLFGKPIFAENLAKDFANAQKSTSKIKKDLQTTPFDEMNVLADTSTSSTSGGGIPSMTFEDVEIPEWLQKFAELIKPIVDAFNFIINKYGVVAGGIIIVISAIMGFWVIKGIIELFTGFGKAVTGISADFTGFLNSFGKAVEIIAILGGLALVIKQVANLIDVFSKSGLEVQDVAGLMASVFLTVVAAMTAIAAVAKILTSDPLTLLGIVALTASISTILLVVAKTLPTILDAVGKFINTIAPSLIAIFAEIYKGIEKIIKALGETLISVIYSVGDLFNTIFNGIDNIVNSVGNVIVKVLQTIQGLISGTFQSLINFIFELGPAVNNFVDNTITAVTKLVNFVVSAIEYLINRTIDGINGIAGVINMLPGVNIRTKSYVSIPRFRPKLAVGAILNNPGRGVPVGGGSAIAGEAGREGILPLTDSQAMETLGEAIGRYVTINANIVNSMNGRVISRQTQKIQNDNNFAYNM